mmetsp:Transcript_12419/g.23770  ORF Transcript_12419/g.23770 Transcript_12419/m.23770 type:complete len:516 (+) Transcript_12419:78-1625(+)
MDEEQSETEMSGIFTYADGNSSMGGSRPPGYDESIDIVSNYPALDDDDSVIISDDDLTSGVSSGVYTEQNDPSGKIAASGSSKTNFEKLYDIENSISDGNTNEIMGEYGTKESNSHKNRLDDMGSNKSPHYDQPIKTMPTGDTSPDRSTPKQTGAIYGSPPHSRFAGKGRGAPPDEGDSSKLCGMPVSRVIMISACCVVIALVVVVVSVVLASQDDGGSGTRETEFEDRPDLSGFLTPSPSQPPVETPPVPPPTPAESGCLPDDDGTSFTVADVEVNCEWLRGRDEFFIQVVCDETEGVDGICSTTCVCGTTTEPTSVPTGPPTFVPTGSPTTAEPSTSSPTPLDFTQFPTSPTDPPTFPPTAAPTTQPTDGPTRFPTANPTTNPTLAPTGQPTPPPTRAPTRLPTRQPTSPPTRGPTLAPNVETLSPTFTQAPTIFTTAAPTVFATRALTNPPTSQPTITLNCADDLPGSIPFSPSFWTCSWLAQVNAVFRRAQCQEGDPAYFHCPTTCRSCAP